MRTRKALKQLFIYFIVLGLAGFAFATVCFTRMYYGALSGFWTLGIVIAFFVWLAGFLITIDGCDFEGPNND